MPLTIAQISDIHCGSPLHDRELLELAVEEILDLAPDVVVVAGDLTQEGYPDEFQAARDALRPLLEALTTIVIPGNHDAKNVGYVHFEDLFGKGEDGRADRVLHLRREAHPERVAIVAVDSSMPDLAEGEVGRERYSWIREQFGAESQYRILVMHHHLVSVPGTGRERNIVWDAGDLLEVLEDCSVDMVMCGHKHVPHVWVLGRMMLVMSGTVSSWRTRGYTRPSYNVVEIDRNEVQVTLVYPGTGQRRAATYDRSTGLLDRNPELADMFSKDNWRW